MTKEAMKCTPWPCRCFRSMLVSSLHVALMLLVSPSDAVATCPEAEEGFSCIQETEFYDVIVVGGTASGVGAALAAAELGKTVALVEKTPRLGGMITNGLGNTDLELGELKGWECFPDDKPGVGRTHLSAGLFEDFRQEIWNYYRGRCPEASLDTLKGIWNNSPKGILDQCEHTFKDNPACRETCKSEFGFRYESKIAKQELNRMVNRFSCQGQGPCPLGRITWL